MTGEPHLGDQLWLLLMKGPPGSGKSTVARELGRRLRWPVVDKDDVRDLLPYEIGGLSYEAMLAIAQTQLRLGLSVIADSPLGYARSYRRALEIAAACGANVAVLEVVCSNPVLWRARIDGRQGVGLAAHHTTSWDRVEAFFQRSAADPFTVDVPRIEIDTATQKVPQAIEQVLEALARLGAGRTGAMHWAKKEPLWPVGWHSDPQCRAGQC